VIRPQDVTWSPSALSRTEPLSHETSTYFPPSRGPGGQLRLASQCSPRYRFSSFVRSFSQVQPSHFNAQFNTTLQSQGYVTKPIAISHAPPTAHRRPGSQCSRLRSHCSRDRVTGPGARHPPPPGGRRALARFDAAPPLLASTRSARLASGSGSFAGARLLLAVARRSRLCPSRRASRRARATSGAVSLRSTAPPSRSLTLADRGGVLPIGDRSPTSPAPLARPRPARWPGSVPSPPIEAGLSCRAEGATRRGEPSAARRGGGLPLPRGYRRAAERKRAGTVAASGPHSSIAGRSAAPSGINGRPANQLVPFGARGGSSLDWPPGTPPRFFFTRSHYFTITIREKHNVHRAPRRSAVQPSLMAILHAGCCYRKSNPQLAVRRTDALFPLL